MRLQIRLRAFILTTLISSVLLINCSKIDEDIAPKAVSFSSAVINADWGTKGATDNVVETLGVMVFTNTQEWAKIAHTTTPNIMYDGTLSKNGNNWAASPAIYWPPNTYSTSFFAYSPKSTNDNGITLSTKEKTGVPTISYQMPILATNQPALMLANPVLNQNQETNAGVVELALSHGLTAIGFHIKGDNTIMKVKSIGIRNIKDKGTVSMDNTNILWENIGTNTTKLYNAGLISDAGISPTPTETNITSDNGYLMVIPQVLESAVVVISFSGSTGERIIPLTNGTEWKVNQPRIYLINLPTSGEISVTVQDWTSTEETVPELL